MPLTDSQIRALKATDKRQKPSCGDSLCLLVEPISKGGGKSFVGRMRFPPGRDNPVVDVRIGVYGKGPGKWSLKEAKDEWSAIKTWSRENNRDPRDRKREQNRAFIQRATSPTFEQACESYLSEWTSANNQGKKEYRNLLWNQVLPEFGVKTPVEQLSWDYQHPGGKTSRELMVDYLGRIRRKAPTSAIKQQMVLKGVFENAIRKGWMGRDQNPALNVTSPKDKSSHKVQHHPYPFWDQLPEFFEVFAQNKANGESTTRAGCLLTFLTGLRVGAISGMRWDEVDSERNLWLVPASRMKTWDDEEKNHLVPLTAPIKDLLREMEKLNGCTDFVFASPRTQSRQLNPSSINNHFIDLGYKGIFSAHGIRTCFLTYGQEVLGFDEKVIRLQGGWKVKDKIQGIYDRHDFLDERRKFMNAWSDALLAQGLNV